MKIKIDITEKERSLIWSALENLAAANPEMKNEIFKVQDQFDVDLSSSAKVQTFWSESLGRNVTIPE